MEGDGDEYRVGIVGDVVGNGNDDDSNDDDDDNNDVTLSPTLSNRIAALTKRSEGRQSPLYPILPKGVPSIRSAYDW